jgi:hypothetical protein
MVTFCRLSRGYGVGQFPHHHLSYPVHRTHRACYPSLALAHQAGMADDVYDHDRGEAAGLGHCSGIPAL